MPTTVFNSLLYRINNLYMKYMNTSRYSTAYEHGDVHVMGILVPRKLGI